jgi:FkbM family methyltransferase
MAATCTGRQSIKTWQSPWSKLRFALRKRLTTQLAVAVDTFDLRFVCNGPIEEMRVRTLFTKEEGTVAWLQESLRPGHVFLDIGANIGLYSMIAAQLVGPEGKVFAVEPHAVNVMSLMQNVSLNKFQDRVKVLACALHDSSGVFDFNYRSLEPGSAMSQLNSTKDSAERPFKPVMVEKKLAASVDDLIARGAMASPNHVKIDVDGNEMQILEGMCRLLGSDQKPQTIQVEVNLRYKADLFTRMEGWGYRHASSHYTEAGKLAIAAKKPVDDIPYNAIFVPRA